MHALEEELNGTEAGSASCIPAYNPYDLNAPAPPASAKPTKYQDLDPCTCWEGVGCWIAKNGGKRLTSVIVRFAATVLLRAQGADAQRMGAAAAAPVRQVEAACSGEQREAAARVYGTSNAW
jgi:hypothetical protein